MNSITEVPFQYIPFMPQGKQRSKRLTKHSVLNPRMEALDNVVAEYRRPTVADRAG